MNKAPLVSNKTAIKKKDAPVLNSWKKPKEGTTKIPKSENPKGSELPVGTFLDGPPLRSKTFNLAQQPLVRAKTRILRQACAVDDNIHSDIVNAIVAKNTRVTTKSTIIKNSPTKNNVAKLPKVEKEVTKPSHLKEATVVTTNNIETKPIGALTAIEIKDVKKIDTEMKPKLRKAKPLTKSPQKIYRKSNFNTPFENEGKVNDQRQENRENDVANESQVDQPNNQASQKQEAKRPVLTQSSSVNTSSIDAKKTSKKMEAKKISGPGANKEVEVTKSPMKLHRKKLVAKDFTPNIAECNATNLMMKGNALKR